MKPNTALIKYKGQPAVNLNNVVTVYVDAPLVWTDEYRVKFEFVGGGGDSWLFKTQKEAESAYKKICSLFVTDLT